MSYSNPSLPAVPFALAFSIEELLLVRSWAQQRDLCMVIATDQVVNGNEYEEMLIVAPKGRQRRTITIWRTAQAVFAQTPQSRPRAFNSVRDLLLALRPAHRQRQGWRRLLRMAG